VKTIELKPAKGVRNDIALERFVSGDLDVGNNIDVDDTGKIFRRLGSNLVLAGNMHSLKSLNGITCVVNNGTLNHVDTDLSLTPLQGGIKHRVAYAEANGAIFWSDTEQSGIVAQKQNSLWGVPVPTLPTVIEVYGDMRAGTYLYSLTFVRGNSLESGAPMCGSITVGNNAGLSFTGIPVSADPFVTSTRIYVSAQNGELPFLAAEIPNTQTSLGIAALGNQALALRTLLKGPPPPGQVLGYYNGRVYVGSGPFLCYSEPHEYELFDMANGYFSLGSDIKTFAPVADGIFVGTEKETIFLSGADPSEFIRKQKAPYGTVLGTEHYIRNDLLLGEGVPGMAAAWMSKTGVCVGLESGDMRNLTSDRYIIAEPTEGASLFKMRSGTPQLVTTVYS
jgi:hypothetical protein